MIPRTIIALFLLYASALPLAAQNFNTSILAYDLGGVGDVVARDFDLDGDVDVLIGTFWPGGTIYCERLAFDSLVQYDILVSGGSARYLDAGDLDNDGDADGALALWDDDACAVLRNTRASDPVELFDIDSAFVGGGGPFAVLAADVTGDGLTDLVTSELRNATNQVRVFEQLNGELVEIWLSSLPFDPLGLAAGDLNDDGVNEIFIAAGQEGGFYVMRRTEIGGFSLSREVTDYTIASVAVADMDGDGALDVVGCDYGGDRLRIWEESGNGWTVTQLPGGVINPRDVRIADFDADGLLDIAATAQGEQSNGGGVYWWRQSVSGSYAFQQLQGEQGFYGMDLADYDRDGDLDILAANVETEQIMLYRNLMGSPTRIIGMVTADRGGAPIAGAVVTVEETGTAGVTDAQGRYELGIVAGTFTVRIEHACWSTQTATGVETQSNDTTFVDFQLQRPELDLPVSSLNVFVQNDRSTTHDLWIANHGDAPLHIASEAAGLLPATDWISLAPATLVIPAGEAGLLQITLSPDTANDASYEFVGEITLRTNSCPDTVVLLAVVAVVLDAPERNAGLPLQTTLSPAYPNPFNAIVNLPLAIAQAGEYKLSVYDLLGREVTTLYDGSLAPGHFTFQWSASSVASGRYVAVLRSQASRWEAPLVLVK